MGARLSPRVPIPEDGKPLALHPNTRPGQPVGLSMRLVATIRNHPSDPVHSQTKWGLASAAMRAGMPRSWTSADGVRAGTVGLHGGRERASVTRFVAVAMLVHCPRYLSSSAATRAPVIAGPGRWVDMTFSGPLLPSGRAPVVRSQSS